MKKIEAINRVSKLVDLILKDAHEGLHVDHTCRFHTVSSLSSFSKNVTRLVFDYRLLFETDMEVGEGEEELIKKLNLFEETYEKRESLIGCINEFHSGFESFMMNVNPDNLFEDQEGIQKIKNSFFELADKVKELGKNETMNRIVTGKQIGRAHV